MGPLPPQGWGHPWHTGPGCGHAWPPLSSSSGRKGRQRAARGSHEKEQRKPAKTSRSPALSSQPPSTGGGPARPDPAAGSSLLQAEAGGAGEVPGAPGHRESGLPPRAGCWGGRRAGEPQTRGLCSLLPAGLALASTLPCCPGRTPLLTRRALTVKARACWRWGL